MTTPEKKATDRFADDSGRMAPSTAQLRSAPFKRKIGPERVMLMLPLNVVLAGRVHGPISLPQVNSALEALTRRHPFLSVRVVIDEDGTGWYVSEGAHPLETQPESRHDEQQWLTRVKQELQTPFPLDTGPLVRCVLIHSPETSEIILCGHHAICDGMSMGYLLRDLLTIAAESESTGSMDTLHPPAIDFTTAPTPPSTRKAHKTFMDWINKKWSQNALRFGEADMRRMQQAYWKQNAGMEVLAWGMDQESTSALVERCHSEGVTVNSALWTAFLAAQCEVQGDRPKYRRHSGLAVNTRDKLIVPAGEAFGFYASSLTVDLSYSQKKSFWDNARIIHSAISRELAKTNLFRMLAALQIHPTLLDSLYFNKYDGLNKFLPRMFLRKMGWHKTTYGYAITNVGRFDIPTTYGPLSIEAVYGPIVYSDVEEKIVGVITVGGKLSFAISFNESAGIDGRKLVEASRTHLKEVMKP